MSRSGGEPGRTAAGGRRARLGRPGLAALVLTGAVLAGPAAAQPPPAAAEAELSGSVRQGLRQIQEHWLQLTGAFQRAEADRATSAIDDLGAQARALGFVALPDLALGSWAAALRAAGAGRAEEAELALAAGERLDPGRPEGAFAAARVAAEQGRWLAAAGSWLGGLRRLVAQPAERGLVLLNLGSYALWVFAAAGLLLVGLAAAAHGPALVADLADLARRRLAGAAVPVAVGIFLVWPLALPPWPPWPPMAAVWLALWWSALLWPSFGGGLRVCVAGLWLAMAAAPFAVAEHRLRVEVALSPPVRALDAVASQRLYGSLFADLAMLRAQLPTHPAVLQLLGDLHRRMGDWDSARGYYRDVLAAEPGNLAARLDLGAFYFYRRDYGTAAEHFQAATEVGGGSAAAFYNLSQTFRESYEFDRAREMGDRARTLDAQQVDRWIREQTRLAVFDQGIERAKEVQGALLAARRESAGDGRRGIGTALALVGLALAAGAAVLLRRGVSAMPGGSEPAAPTGVAPRALVPGWVSMCEGRGPAAFAALVPVVALAGLPFAHEVGYRLPLGLVAGDLGAWPAVALGLVALFAGRLAWELRGSR